VHAHSGVHVDIYIAHCHGNNARMRGKYEPLQFIAMVAVSSSRGAVPLSERSGMARYKRLGH
jgi:hypothetical protein